MKRRISWQKRDPQKTRKKACKKCPRPINAQGNYTQTGKSVDALVAIPLQTAFHIEIPSTS
jgi:hypothetical protein